MKLFPERGLLQVLAKGFEKVGIELDLAAFELVPASIGRCARDTEVDPSGRDLVCNLIVQYCLEGRHHLRSLLGLYNYGLVVYAYTHSPNVK